MLVKKARRMVRRLSLGALGLALAAGTPLLGASTAWAQDGPQKKYINQPSFFLPVVLDSLARNQVSEIRIYVKRQASDPWALVGACNPAQGGIQYQADKEGEYWFTMVTVDKTGHASPAQVQQASPGMSVVVDLSSPQIDVSSIMPSAEGKVVQVSLKDANADPSKVTFQYQTRDLVWRTLEATPGKALAYCIPSQANVTGMVRMTAVDYARNTATKEFNLDSALIESSPTANNPLPSPGIPSTAVPATAQNTPSLPLPNIPVPTSLGALPPPSLNETLPMLPPPGGDPVIIQTGAINPIGTPPVVTNPVVTPPAKETPLVERVLVQKVDISGPVLSPNLGPIDTKVSQHTPPTSSTLGTAKLLNNDAASNLAPPIGSAQPSSLLSIGAASGRPGQAPVNRKLINSTQLVLEYTLEKVGVSGVGRVEVWLTRDQGQSWEKLGEDVDNKSPVALELPGEGLYGLALVVSNGRGFGGQPPKSGEAPEGWIEVDLTRPTADFVQIRQGNQDDAGSLHIAWSTRDKNLGADPVDLYYAPEPSGPWQPIARGLRADGQYRWVPPTSLGSQAYIRLAAHDQAGNVTQSDTTQPIALDDLSRPRGRIFNIAPYQSAGPRGN